MSEGYTIVFDNASAKAAADELTKSFGSLDRAIENAGNASANLQKNLLAAMEAAKQAEQAYARVQTDHNRQTAAYANAGVMAYERQAKAAKELVAELEKLKVIQGIISKSAFIGGFAKQEAELAKLNGQLSKFQAGLEQTIFLKKQELEISQRASQVAAIRTAEGQALLKYNAELKATIDSELQLAGIQAKYQPDVLNNLKQMAVLQQQLRKEIETAAAVSKTQADAEIKLAEARARDTEEIKRMVKETNELNEAFRRATMTERQMADQMERDLKAIRVAQEAVAKQKFPELTGGLSEEFVKLQKLAERFYGTNNAELKELLIKFRQVSEAAKEGFRTGKGVGDYIAQLQVLTDRMNQVQKESAETSLGFKKVDDSARRTAKGIGILNIAASLSRNILDAMGRHISVYAGGFLGVSAAAYGLTRAMRSVISVGSDFSENMQRAGAVMRATGGQISAMSDITRDLAARTVFTAAEASEALVQLGMSGLTVQESITALEPTLKLASIGMLDFGKTADLVTNIMQGFQLSAADIPRIADVLASAVTSSNATVEQMANAMSYAAPVAQSFGISLEAVAASMEVLHNAGIKSSRAGTGLRRILLSLYTPTVKGAEALAKLNVSMVDGEGKTKSFISVMKEVSAAVAAGKGSLEDLVAIVGVRAAPAFLQLVKASGSATDALTTFYEANLLAAGAADTMQKTIEDYIGADWKKLVAALQEVGLKLFDMVKDDLREGIKNLTQVLLSLSNNDQALKDLAEIIKTVGEALAWLAGLMVAGGLLRGISLITSGFSKLNASIGSFLGAIGGGAMAKGIANLLGIGKAAAPVKQLSFAFTEASVATKGLTKWLGLGVKGLGTLATAFGPVGLAAGALALYFSDDIVDGITAAIDTGKRFLGFKETIAEVTDSVVTLKEELAGIKAPELSVDAAARAIAAVSKEQNVLLQDKFIDAQENLDVTNKQVAALEQQEKVYSALVERTGTFKLELYNVEQKLKEAKARQIEWNQQVALLGGTILANVKKQLQAQVVVLETSVSNMKVQLQNLRLSAGQAFAANDVAGYENYMVAIQQGERAIAGWETEIQNTVAAVKQLDGQINTVVSHVKDGGVQFKDLTKSAEEVRDLLQMTPTGILKDELSQINEKIDRIKETHSLMEKGAKLEELSVEQQGLYRVGAEDIKALLEDREKLLNKIAAQEKKAAAPAETLKKSLQEELAIRTKFAQIQETATRKALEPERELMEVVKEKQELYTSITETLGQLSAKEIQWAEVKKVLTAQVSRYNSVLTEELSTRKKIAAAQAKAKKDLDNYAKSVSAGYQATLTYNKHINNLKQLLVEMPQYTRDWVNEIRDLTREMERGSMTEFQKKLDDFAHSFEKLDEAAASWLDGFADTLTDFIVNGEADFKGFLDGVQRDITKMSVQKIIFHVGTFFDNLTGGNLFAGIDEFLTGVPEQALKVEKSQLTVLEQIRDTLQGQEGELSKTIKDLSGGLEASFERYASAAGGFFSQTFSTSSLDEIPGVMENFVASVDSFQQYGAGIEQAAMLAAQSAEFAADGIALTAAALASTSDSPGVLQTVVQGFTGGGGGGDFGSLLSGAASFLGGGSGLLAGAGSLLESALFSVVPFEAITAAGITASGALGGVAGALSGLASIASVAIPVIGLAVPLLLSLFGDEDPSFAFGGKGALGDFKLSYTEDIEGEQISQLMELINAYDQKLLDVLDAASLEAVNQALMDTGLKKFDIRDAPALGAAIMTRYRNAFSAIDDQFSQAFDDLRYWGYKNNIDSEVILQKGEQLLAVWKQFGMVRPEVRDIVNSLDAWNSDTEQLPEVLAKTFALASDFVDRLGVFSIEAFQFESVDELKDFISSVTNEGETLAETAARVSTNILIMADAMDLAGQSIHRLELTATELVSASDSFVRIAGGAEALQALNTYYFENFLTAEEQRAKKLEIATKTLTRLNDQLGFVGDKAINSKDALRSVIEGLDLTTEAGQTLYVRLIKDLAPAVIEFETLLNSTAEGVETTSSALETFVDLLGKIGANIPDDADPVAFARQWFQELGGEFESLIPALEHYYEVAYTETERNMHAMEAAKEVLDRFNTELGLTGSEAIQSTADLRRLVESLDLSSVEARDLFYRIMTELVPAVETFSEALDELMKKFEVLQDIAYALDIPNPGSNRSITDLQEFFALTGDDNLVTGLEALNQALSDLANERKIRELEEIFGSDLPMNMGEFADMLLSLNTATADGMDSFKEMLTAFPELQSYWADLIEEIEANIAALDELIDSFDALSDSITDSINEITGAVRSLEQTADDLWASVRSGDLSYEDRLSAAEELHDLIMDQYDDEADAIQSAYDARIDAIENVYNEEMARYEEIESALKGLQQYTRQLLLGDLTPLDPGEQLAEAATQFASLLAAARGGDADAMAELQTSATTLLEAAQAVYASGPDYVSIFNDVMAALQSIENPLEDPTANYDAQIAAATAEMNASLAALRARTADQLEQLKAVVEAIKAEIEAQKAEEEARLQRLLESFADVRDKLREAFLNAGDNITSAILDSAQDLPPEQLELLNQTITALKDVQGMVEQMGDLSVDELRDSGASLDAIREATRSFLSLYELMQQTMPEQAAELAGIADGIQSLATELGIDPADIATAAGLAELDIGTQINTGFEGVTTQLVEVVAILTQGQEAQLLVKDAVTAHTAILENIGAQVTELVAQMATALPEVSAQLLELATLGYSSNEALTGLASGSNSVAAVLREQGALIVTGISNINAANDDSVIHLASIDSNVISLVERMEAKTAENREQAQHLEAQLQQHADMVAGSIHAMGELVSSSVKSAGDQVTGAVHQSTQAQAEVANNVASLRTGMDRMNNTLQTVADQNRQILNQTSSTSSGVK